MAAPEEWEPGIGAGLVERAPISFQTPGERRWSEDLAEDLMYKSWRGQNWASQQEEGEGKWWVGRTTCQLEDLSGAFKGYCVLELRVFSAQPSSLASIFETLLKLPTHPPPPMDIHSASTGPPVPGAPCSAGRPLQSISYWHRPACSRGLWLSCYTLAYVFWLLLIRSSAQVGQVPIHECSPGFCSPASVSRQPQPSWGSRRLPTSLVVGSLNSRSIPYLLSALLSLAPEAEAGGVHLHCGRPGPSCKESREGSHAFSFHSDA